MAYSSEEIQAAVEKLVRSGIRRQVDHRGVRKVDLEFDDIRELAASVLIQYPNSPYYLMMLGLDRLNGLTSSLVLKISVLLEKIEAVGRRVGPVDDISSLIDATNALVGLEAALSSRRDQVADPSTLPAYIQWQSSSAKYLAKIGAGVKEGGEIVDTPNQARAEIPALLAEIVDEYRAIEEMARYLQRAPDEFTSLQLPAAVAQNVVARAKEVLEQDRQELEGMSDEQRLEVARGKTLNVLAARAIIDAYVKGQTTKAEIGLVGVVTPYADGGHEANPAYVAGGRPGPWGLVSYPRDYHDPPDSRDNNVLEFTLQGGVSVRVVLPTSFVAFLTGTGRPNPNDDDTQNPPVVGVYTFYGTGRALGPNPPPPQVGDPPRYCENFDAEHPNQWFFPDPNDVLIIDQKVEGGPTTRYTIHLIDKSSDPETTFVYPPLQVPPLPDQSWTGYKLQLTRQQVVDRINAVLVAQSSYLRARKSEMGGIEIYCRDPIEAIVDRVVGILIPSVKVGAVETNSAAANPLGFVLGLEMMGRRTQAMTIVDYVNSNTSRVVASLVAFPTLPEFDHMIAWTSVVDPAGLVLAKFSGVGSIVSTGTTITLTISPVFDPFSTWKVQAGDVICLPRQYVQSGSTFIPLPDEGARYTVTGVNGRVLTATHSSGPIAETYVQRMFDVGLASVLNHVAPHQVAQVFTAPNDGAFEISEVDQFSPFRVHLNLLLSQYKQTNEALPLQLEVTLGPASVGFASADLSTASYIKVEGSCRPLLFSAVPEARGTTQYVQLPKTNIKAHIGDRLDFKSGSVYWNRLVQNVEDRILTLNGTVPCSETWTAGSPGQYTVQLVSGAKKNADSKSLDLDAWAKKEPTDINTYAANVNAALNPILANRVPAAGAINDAKKAVQVLSDKLSSLQELSSVQLTGPAPGTTPTKFWVEPIPAIDDLLVTLRSKGAERGADLLLMCRFGEFFGLDMDEMSYVGAMQKAAREVARNDLAVSRFGASRIRRKVLSIQEGTDPDYDHSDSDALPSPPDPTSGLDLPSNPDRA